MASAHEMLDASIQSSISGNTKREIIKHLWGRDIHPRRSFTGEINYNPYFYYYAEQIGLALHDGGRHTSVRTHRDIIDIAQQLRNGSMRNEIRQLLLPKLATSAMNEDE